TGDPQSLLPHLLRGEVECVAGHDRSARTPRAHRIGQLTRIAGLDMDCLERDSQLIGDDLGEDRRMGLPVGRQAGPDVHPSGGLDLSVSACVGPGTGALDVAGEADAYPAALAAGLLTVGFELVPADDRLEF